VTRPLIAPTALERALKLLAVRARTEAELDRALARAQVPDQERAAALARVRELGYLNDAEVATSRARSLLERGVARRMAAQRLRSQGVSVSVAQEALDGAAEGAGEQELVERALARRLRGRQPRDEKERRRIFRSLVQQGHRAALVAAAVGLRWDGADEAPDEGVSDDGADG
jgi:regulatory protein